MSVPTVASPVLQEMSGAIEHVLALAPRVGLKTFTLWSTWSLVDAVEFERVESVLNKLVARGAAKSVRVFVGDDNRCIAVIGL